MNNTEGQWEKRWHPLREEWVVYSAHRNKRPWQGADLIKAAGSQSYISGCYLCPGNPRVHGSQNPSYESVFVFDNDHPVVGTSAPDVRQPIAFPLYKRERARGIARVICFDPKHNTSLAQMPLGNVQRVFQVMREQSQELSENPLIKSVLIFENKGEAVGVSNTHPHGQIYATDFTFRFIGQQIEIANRYRSSHGSNLFEDIIAAEQRDGIRIVAENDQAVAFIPFFARYAYEVMIFPKSSHQTFVTFEDNALDGIAAIFHQVVRKLDMNYQMSFPYVMTVMQAPVDGGNYDQFRFHIWIQPPFRQPGLIKYLAGPEIGGGNFMADTMPEEKAAELNKIDPSKYGS